jgi:hypothetical protein
MRLSNQLSNDPSGRVGTAVAHSGSRCVRHSEVFLVISSIPRPRHPAVPLADPDLAQLGISEVAEGELCLLLGRRPLPRDRLQRVRVDVLAAVQLLRHMQRHHLTCDLGVQLQVRGRWELGRPDLTAVQRDLVLGGGVVPGAVALTSAKLVSDCR